MMKYIQCMNCDEWFEFDGASWDQYGGWHTGCPCCNSSFDIDIEDFVIPEGTLVRMKAAPGNGRVIKIDTNNVTEFQNINYLVEFDDNIGVWLRYSQIEVVDDWRLLVRTPSNGIQRVCHFPKNKEYGNAPCYGCADRTKCNAAIFERLTTYEDSGFTPEEVQQIAETIKRIGRNRL